MQASGIRTDQITQVRGFADQHLRKPEVPLDPANRRISLIVQYIVRNVEDGEGAGKSDEKSPAVK
jgi:chemotaxis protein MotB